MFITTCYNLSHSELYAIFFTTARMPVIVPMSEKIPVGLVKTPLVICNIGLLIGDNTVHLKL